MAPVFGTAHLHSIVPTDQVGALLETAWQAGFRHFDTAPSYGFGETEAVLGRFLRGHSDTHTTVTSKVGIAASARPGRAKRAARSVARRLPAGARDRLRGNASPEGGAFGVARVRESIESSLAQLHRIDRLLLHEVTADDITDELLTELGRYVDRGDVASLGVATSPGRTVDALGRAATRLVTANMSVAPGSPLPRLPEGVELVGHGPLGAGGIALQAVAADRQRRPVRWDAALAATPWRDAAEALVAHSATRPGVDGLIVTSSRPARLPRLFEVADTARPLPPELAALIESACA